MTVSIVAQIAEVDREIVMREKVYPQWVKANKMHQGEADFHLGRMRAVLRTLKWLQRNEAAIKGKIKTPASGELAGAESVTETG
jgi:hypothetical protein